MSIEDLNEEQIRSMEAEIAARRSEVKPTYQHYGSAENLSDNEIRGMEAEIAARRSEVKPTYQHYGSTENMSSEDIRILEAQAAEKRKQDIPYKKYLNNLISSPHISDYKQFESAVIHSMQSNRIMKNFTSTLVEEISKVTYVFKNIDKNDVANIENNKQKLEQLFNIYMRYLYELKNHGWDFDGPGNSIGMEMINSDMLEDLWQVQKKFDITFNMPIPKNLGEYYGKAFERSGKMVPGITLMYDDLKNKEVNWHQVLNYKENELTPRQRYDLARQNELNNVLSRVQNDNLAQNQEQVETHSARR